MQSVDVRYSWWFRGAIGSNYLEAAGVHLALYRGTAGGFTVRSSQIISETQAFCCLLPAGQCVVGTVETVKKLNFLKYCGNNYATLYNVYVDKLLEGQYLRAFFNCYGFGTLLSNKTFPDIKKN